MSSQAMQSSARGAAPAGGNPVISDAQVAAYREKGFVVVENIYSANEVARMRAALAATARGLTAHNDLIDLEPSHRPNRPRVRRVKDPFGHHPVFAEMARHPRLTAALTPLIGPDQRLHGSKINLKSAEYGAPVEWHQDWAFYPHTNDDVLAVGVMLDDMTEDNEPLLCLPGTHRGPVYDHHQDGRFAGALDPQTCDLDFDRAEMITGKAGDCSIHHVRTVHGSAQNRSGRDRRLLLYEVAAADAWDLTGLELIGSWDDLADRMLASALCDQPRLDPVPVRLPYPGPLKGGSIYESQTVVRNTYFADKG